MLGDGERTELPRKKKEAYERTESLTSFENYKRGVI